MAPSPPAADLAAQVRLRRARRQAWALLGAGQVGPESELLDPTRPRWLHLVTAGRGVTASGVRWDLLDRQPAPDEA